MYFIWYYLLFIIPTIFFKLFNCINNRNIKTIEAKKNYSIIRNTKIFDIDDWISLKNEILLACDNVYLTTRKSTDNITLIRFSKSNNDNNNNDIIQNKNDESIEFSEVNLIDKDDIKLMVTKNFPFKELLPKETSYF